MTPEKNTEQRIEPCPICGEKAHVMVQPVWRDRPKMYYVACDRTGPTEEDSQPCVKGRAFKTRGLAVSFWNNRTALSDSKRMGEEILAWKKWVDEALAGKIAAEARVKELEADVAGYKRRAEAAEGAFQHSERLLAEARREGEKWKEIAREADTYRPLCEKAEAERERLAGEWGLLKIALRHSQEREKGLVEALRKIVELCPESYASTVAKAAL